MNDDLERRIADLETRLKRMEANQTIRINKHGEPSKDIIKIRGEYINLTGNKTEYSLPESAVFESADSYEVTLVEEGTGTEFPKRQIEKISGGKFIIHSDTPGDTGRVGIKITEL